MAEQADRVAFVLGKLSLHLPLGFERISVSQDQVTDPRPYIMALDYPGDRRISIAWVGKDYANLLDEILGVVNADPRRYFDLVFGANPEAPPPEASSEHVLWQDALETRRLLFATGSNPARYVSDSASAYVADTGTHLSARMFVVDHENRLNVLEILARGFDSSDLARLLGSISSPKDAVDQ
ncbi:hypothetical protein [Thioalkalivibrio denitrificans]|uniref:hypothetical protein n=1 Tax=Thioalkalivibrio denitrificans TaxID=108003 RepID=UPI0011159A7C|nr:hypothetical protein [Thioalkalivibrio denitrificans]